MSRTTTPELVLDMAEIQGIALPGFFKPHHTLLYLRLPPGSRDVVDHFKTWLAGLSGQLATAGQTYYEDSLLPVRPVGDQKGGR